MSNHIGEKTDRLSEHYAPYLATVLIITGTMLLTVIIGWNVAF